MDEMRAHQEEQQRPQGHSSGSPLRSERGGTIISDNVVSKIAGIAIQESSDGAGGAAAHLYSLYLLGSYASDLGNNVVAYDSVTAFASQG